MRRITGGGLEESSIQKSEIILSPNPTSGDLNISVPKEFIGEEIFVYDLSGRKILRVAVSAVSCNLQTVNFASGIYFVKIGTVAKKFVKQ